MTDTIFALSSGPGPAAIGVIRISGPSASRALEALAGRVTAARRATATRLHDAAGELLDDALVLWLPGPGTATGEDTVELHCHGGRAVLAAVEQALERMPTLRRAKAGEFTRRAFVNGRLDLAEAEGLADLLAAETELQRRSALAMASGALSTVVEGWRQKLLEASGAVEAVLDFGDEDDVGELPADFIAGLEQLQAAISEWLARPRAEMLREGLRVVLAGPPNAGKSTLFNALVSAEAAIVTPIAGTTRDVITRPVQVAGIPFLFVDTAGLRSETGDRIEALGIDRARAELLRADLVLWLGSEGEGPAGAWEVEAKIDCADRLRKPAAAHRVSAATGAGLATLWDALTAFARTKLPLPGDAALNERQHRALAEATDMLKRASEFRDPLLVAEQLRLARVALDALVGRTSIEHVLDTLFGRFCIGK